MASDDERLINMKTITSELLISNQDSICFLLAWSTRETEFRLGEHFNVSYGQGKDGGTLYNICNSPRINTIECRY